MSVPPQSAESSPRVRRRLPLPVVLGVAVFGVAWTALSFALIVTGGGGSGGVRAATVIANLGGGLLVCAVAWLGSRPRPMAASPLARQLLVTAAAAPPVLAAVVEGYLGKQQHVTTSAGMDLVTTAVAAVALVAVYRSRPTGR